MGLVTVCASPGVTEIWKLLAPGSTVIVLYWLVAGLVVSSEKLSFTIGFIAPGDMVIAPFIRFMKNIFESSTSAAL